MIRIMAALAAFVFAIALALPANARQRHCHHHRSHNGHHHSHNGNIALAIITTANGLTAKVAIAVRDKFQAFIDAIEVDHVEPETGELTKGYRISDLGCYARGGHMPHSLHYRGLACDFDQQKRSVTSEKMYHVASEAHAAGLEDGCEWRRAPGQRGKYHGADCGHIQATPAESSTTLVARRHHHRHRHHRMAMK